MVGFIIEILKEIISLKLIKKETMKKTLFILLVIYILIGCSTNNELKLIDDVKLIEYINNGISIHPKKSFDGNDLVKVQHLKSIKTETYKLKKKWIENYTHIPIFVDNYIINDKLSTQDSIYFLDFLEEIIFNKNGLISSSHSKNSSYYTIENINTGEQKGYFSYYEEYKSSYKYNYISDNEIQQYITINRIDPNKKSLSFKGMVSKESKDTIKYSNPNKNEIIVHKSSINETKKYRKEQSKNMDLEVYIQNELSNDLVFSSKSSDGLLTFEIMRPMYSYKGDTHKENQYFYDASGLLKKHIQTIKPRNFETVVTYEYNKNEVHITESNKNYTDEEIIKLKYDSHGNWVYKKDIHTGQITFRKINYYE